MPTYFWDVRLKSGLSHRLVIAIEKLLANMVAEKEIETMRKINLLDTINLEMTDARRDKTSIAEIHVEEPRTTEAATIATHAEVVRETGKILAEMDEASAIEGRKKRPLLITIGYAKNVVMSTFHFAKNATAVASPKTTSQIAVIGKPEPKSLGRNAIDLTTNQFANSEKQEANQPTMLIIAGRNHSMPVLEEEIAMIK